MFDALRTRIAVAVAAAAIVGTSLAPIAALAAPLAPSGGDVMVAKPDLKMTVINLVNQGSTGSFSGSMFVENIGNGGASPIVLQTECSRYDTGMPNNTIYFDLSPRILTPLKGGEHTYVTFSCPNATGIQLTVQTPNDSNTGNNVLTVGNFYGS